MYKKLTEFGDEVTLVANSTLQFLDFGLTQEAKKRGRSLEFAEIYHTPEPGGERRVRLSKLAYDEDTNKPIDEQTGEEIAVDATYSVNFADALEAFEDTWLPFPYLKTNAEAARPEDRFKKGPRVWSRVRVTRLEEPDENGFSHRVTVGFDTRLEQPREGAPYASVTPSDVASKSQFQLASRIREFSWYLDEFWVGGWLKSVIEESDAAGRSREIIRMDDKPCELRHWALYIALIEGLADVVKFPRVSFLMTVHEQSNAKQEPPIEVDLVLDIGNNRTCGILVEMGKGGSLGLENAKRLEIRDLEKLEFASDEPFQSRVEFRDASFGQRKFARRAGGSDRVFAWPSPLRLGNEASRHNGASIGSEGLSGLSAPKRYLWDTDAREQQWSYNVTGKPDARPEIVGKLMTHLNDAGERLSRLQTQEYAFRAKFSRASVFSLQVMEIVLHAIRQINDVSYRWSRDLRNVPRRLRRIILTVPSATPVVEQKEFNVRANDGLNLIWEMMEWTEEASPILKKPELRISYDEASCTQLVFLYSEMMDRFQKTAHDYLGLKASPTVAMQGDHALRIASIDIGGGTTDLMIATYGSTPSEPHHLKLQQDFREGFRIAGDDIVQQVISDHVVADIAAALRQAGIAHSGEFMRRLLDARGADAKDRQRRVLFVNQVLLPIAHLVLERYEASTEGQANDPILVSEGFDLDRAPPQALIDFFDTAAHSTGAEGFSLRDVRFNVKPVELGHTIASVMNANLQALLSVVAAHDCDYLLLTGRPSRLPAVRDTVLASMAVPPHHMVFMHQYSIGDWYPFVSAGGVIGDPKTTVAAGALICALAEDSNLTNFSLPRGAFSLGSTANVIGLMDRGGALIPGAELFRRDDEGDYVKVCEDFSYRQPMLIGFRQIDRPNWPATPLFRIHVPPDEMDEEMKRSIPLTISAMARRMGEQEDERFRIMSVTDESGQERNKFKTRLRLQLQTILDEEGFWTDTGRLNIPSDI